MGTENQSSGNLMGWFKESQGLNVRGQRPPHTLLKPACDPAGLELSLTGTPKSGIQAKFPRMICVIKNDTRTILKTRDLANKLKPEGGPSLNPNRK